MDNTADNISVASTKSILKRPITDNEFAAFIDAITNLYSNVVVPVFSPEWEAFTYEQQLKVRHTFWGTGKEFKKKMEDLEKALYSTYP